MPCYHPNFMIYNDGVLGRFGGKLSEKALAAKLPGQEFVPIPCGKCVGCRLERSKAWADRMLLEFATEREDIPAKTALFITLTYDQEHVPIITGTDGLPLRTLRPDDAQLFIKRIRYYYQTKFGRRLRFYLAGEYGSQTWRPHMHLVLFGARMEDFPDAYLYSHDSQLDTDLYESPILDEIWSFGAVRFSPASYATFAYVGRYVLKKQFGSDGGAMVYRGRVPPFSRMSNRPGLGSDFFHVTQDGDFMQGTQVHLSDGVNVHQIGIPRLVYEKIKLTNPELYDRLKAQQRYIAGQRNDLLEQQIDKPKLQYLRDCERDYLRRTEILSKRSKV